MFSLLNIGGMGLFPLYSILTLHSLTLSQMLAIFKSLAAPRIGCFHRHRLYYYKKSSGGKKKITNVHPGVLFVAGRGVASNNRPCVKMISPLMHLSNSQILGPGTFPLFNCTSFQILVLRQYF